MNFLPRRQLAKHGEIEKILVERCRTIAGQIAFSIMIDRETAFIFE